MIKRNMVIKMVIIVIIMVMTMIITVLIMIRTMGIIIVIIIVMVIVIMMIADGRQASQKTIMIMILVLLIIAIKTIIFRIAKIKINNFLSTVGSFFCIFEVIFAIIVILCKLYFQVRNRQSLATNYRDFSDFL